MTKNVLTLFLVGLISSSARAQEVEGAFAKKVFRVAPDKIAALPGVDAQDPKSVFSVLPERLEELAARPDSGVTLNRFAFTVKGAKGKTDVSGNEKDAYILLDFNRTSMQLVRPSAKQVLDLPQESSDPVVTPAPGTPTLQPLGTSMKIGSTNAAGYELKDKGEIVRLWIAKDDAPLARLGKGLRRFGQNTRVPAEATKDLALDLAIPIGMSLRTQFLGSSGYTLEEVSFQKKPVPDSVFALPAGMRAHP